MPVTSGGNDGDAGKLDPTGGIALGTEGGNGMDRGGALTGTVGEDGEGPVNGNCGGSNGNRDGGAEGDGPGRRHDPSSTVARES